MNRRHARAGFSLIEMLMVMAIMAFLFGAIATFMGSTGAAARTAATRATLTKLNSMLQFRYKQVLEEFTEQDRKSGSMRTAWTDVRYASSQYLTGPEPTSAKVAIAKMNRVRGTFPQKIDNTPAGLPIIDTGGLVPADTNPVSWTAFTDPNELLYQILKRGGSKGADEELLDSINPRHIKYLNVDSSGRVLNTERAIFLDDWGEPLRFYLSPTRLVRPGGPYTLPTATQYSVAKTLIPSLPPVPASATDFTSAFNQDPLDTRGMLREPSFSVNQARYFDSPPVVPSGRSFEELYHTPDTFYLPLIVSAGEDQSLGMYEPNDPSANRHGAVKPGEEGAAADNLTSAQR